MIKQVKFKEVTGEILGGILLDSGDIICGCCGNIISAQEVKNGNVEILEFYEYWINISDEIIGED